MRGSRQNNQVSMLNQFGDDEDAYYDLIQPASDIRSNNNDGSDDGTDVVEEDQNTLGIIDSWIANEVMEPSTVKDIHELSENVGGKVLPIFRSGGSAWKSQAGYVRPITTKHLQLKDVPEISYFDIVMGAVNVGDAYKKLGETYGITFNQTDRTGMAILSTMRLNHLGHPMGIELSAFGWGIAKALKGDLSSLGDWTIALNKINEVAAEKIKTYNSEIAAENTARQAKNLPTDATLEMEHVKDMYYWILEVTGLFEGGFVSRPSKPEDLISPPLYVIGHKWGAPKSTKIGTGFVDVYPATTKEPSPIITNSFFLDSLCDLKTKYVDGDLPSSLITKYLGLEKPDGTKDGIAAWRKNRVDLISSPKDVVDKLTTSMTPFGKWPTKGSSPLVPLQQFAINMAIGDEEKRDKGNILIGVNGPPGTGKTTLAKDLLAGLVVLRAIEMCKFDDPQNAFKSMGAGETYEIDPSLKGMEIMVVSANNDAVKNITVEWPALGSLDPDREVSYYPSIAKLIYPGQESWGAISAVLGNRGNRRSFNNGFYWNQDYGFRNRLQYINGRHRCVKVTKEELAKAEIEANGEQKPKSNSGVPKKNEYREPHSAREENLPFNHRQAVERWYAARMDFEIKLDQLKSALAQFPERPDIDSLPFEEFHTASSRKSKEIDYLRESLFISALDLHRAFVYAAATPMANLLTEFTTLMSMEDCKSPGDAMTAISFIFPIFSTTFASVPRMTSAFPDKSIGWLLVDEAGQAKPQMAIAALRVSKNALIVGDPRQVEPVTTINQNLMRKICEANDVEFRKICAPYSSVQVFADKASEYRSVMSDDYESGLCLLVHRRCAEPMASICNKISYGGKMVIAKRPGDSKIRDILGGSRWIDVTSDSSEKFNAEEWTEVKNLLREIKQNNAPLNIYIATPFRDIEQGVKRGINLNWKEIGLTPSDTEFLVKNRVGTIHKLQGREADTIIFVLGAQGNSNERARRWASSRANILNVSLSRAQENIYVVGNRSEWGRLRFFETLENDIDNHPYADYRPRQIRELSHDGNLHDAIADLIMPAA